MFFQDFHSSMKENVLLLVVSTYITFDRQSWFVYVYSSHDIFFLPVKTKPGNPSKSVQFVESVREGRKVDQRIVRHIGVAKTEAGLEELPELGETIKVEIRCERHPR